MQNVWEHNGLYSFLRHYVDWCTRSCFQTLTVEGNGNIPTGDVSVIFACNHCNALMDALVVLQHDHSSTSFGARADIFKNPKIASILQFLRILPLARRDRDGAKACAGNVTTFENAVESMAHGVPFTIYVEGRHRAWHSLLPFKKGIFRIAELSRQTYPERPVWIVPIGIDYSEFLEPVPNCKVKIGKAFEYKEGSDSGEMLQLLKDRISGLMTYFPDDENYDAAWKAYEQAHRTPKRWWHYPAAILLLPFFLVFAAAALPFWGISHIIISGMKDKSWANTARFGCKLALMPILTLIVGLVLALTSTWYITIAALLLLWNAPRLFYLIQKFYRFLLK